MDGSMHAVNAALTPLFMDKSQSRLAAIAIRPCSSIASKTPCYAMSNDVS